MTSPRVLVVLDSSAAWSRGALRGFARIADEKFAGAKLDENFLVVATTAIETVALELNQLATARTKRSP